MQNGCFVLGFVVQNEKGTHTMQFMLQFRTLLGDICSFENQCFSTWNTLKFNGNFTHFGEFKTEKKKSILHVKVLFILWSAIKIEH